MREFRATSLSTHAFSTLYTTLPHNLIKKKLTDLIECFFFQREGSPFLACNERNAYFTSEHQNRYKSWSCQNICEALTYLLDIFITFGTKLYRQIVGIPMGTYFAPLIADLFSFCFERKFMASLYNKKAEIIQAFNLTSWYLEDLLNIENPY